MQSEQFDLHANIEQRHWWFVARREILRSVIGSVLPPSCGSTVVDVGCGTGANLAALADSYNCLGIDTSQEAINLATQRFPDVQFVCGPAHEMPSVVRQANLVLLCDVLEHVSDDFRLLSDLLSLAAPGTYFLITVPANPALWSEHDRAFGHYRRYERPRFEELWHGLDARAIFVSHFNARLYPIVRAVRWWNRRKGRSLGAAGTDFSMPVSPVNGVLRRLFSGERRKLESLARGESPRPYGRGVSLMALLQRGEGAVEPRQRPSFIPPDSVTPIVPPVGVSV